MKKITNDRIKSRVKARTEETKPLAWMLAFMTGFILLALAAGQSFARTYPLPPKGSHWRARPPLWSSGRQGHTKDTNRTSDAHPSRGLAPSAHTQTAIGSFAKCRATEEPR